VRIENDGIGVLDAGPEMPEFRTDNRRSRPRGIDMNVEIMAARDRANRGDIVVPPTLVPPTLATIPAGSNPACPSATMAASSAAASSRAIRRSRHSHKIVVTDARNPDGASIEVCTCPEQ